MLGCQLSTCLSHLIEAEVIFDCSSLLFDVLLQYLPKVVLEAHNRMVIHCGKVLANRVYFHWILGGARCAKYREAHDVVIHKVLQCLLLVRQYLCWRCLLLHLHRCCRGKVHLTLTLVKCSHLRSSLRPCINSLRLDILCGFLVWKDVLEGITWILHSNWLS